MDPSLFAERGELGYSLSHTYGSPLATNSHSDKFLNPSTDGAVPVLQFNRYKINNPVILRISREKLIGLLTEYGYTPYSSRAIPLCAASAERCRVVCAPKQGPRSRADSIELPAATAISCSLQAAGAYS